MEQSGVQPPYYRRRTDMERTVNFLSSAEGTRQLGMDCFNACVKPEQDNTDQLRGFEQRCVDGCIITNMNIFMVNGNKY
jgi:hypothetical protein